MYEAENQEEFRIAEERSKAITKLFKDTFSGQVGNKCLDHLKKTFVDRSMYQRGLSFEETAYRQGQADLVRQIISEVNKDGR